MVFAASFNELEIRRISSVAVVNDASAFLGLLARCYGYVARFAGIFLYLIDGADSSSIAAAILEAASDWLSPALALIPAEAEKSLADCLTASTFRCTEAISSRRLSRIMLICATSTPTSSFRPRAWDGRDRQKRWLWRHRLLHLSCDRYG